MNQNENGLDKSTEKKLEKEATAKVGATAAHAAANYYTGGAYEKFRSAPVVGNVVKGAEKQVGKRLAATPMGRNVRKTAKKLDDAGVVDAADSAVSMMGGSTNKDDVKALNNRGKNEPYFGKDYSKKNSTETQKLNKANELGEKENLKNDSNKSKDKKTPSRFDIVGRKKESFEQKIRSIKVKIFLIGIVSAFILVLLLITAVVSGYEMFLEGVSMFFGVPDSSTEENMADPDGIFDKEDYVINPETGQEYTMDELVLMFKEDSTCSKITIWNKIGDWFDGLDGSYGNICSYIRYIESESKKLESENPGLMLDRAVIISTLFYGYGTQRNYSEYDSTENIEDVLSGNEHYKTLVDVLQSGKITRDNLDSIIDNTVADTTFTYYTWTIEDEVILDKPTGRKIGYCKGEEVKDVKYSLLKWKIFMRYGGEEYEDYDKTIPEIWEQEMSYKKQWDATSEECNGTIPISELSGLVDILDSSVSKAHKELEHGEITDIELFEQAATTEGYEKDIFQDYVREKGQNPVHVVFDYQTGFTYIEFPRFKESFEDPNINAEYDEAVTPKEIETNIEYMVDRKIILNSILLLVDQDDPMRYRGSYDGYSSVITGAYCGDMLTAQLDEIMVRVTDCDGNYLETVSLEDYIIGVAYREVSNVEDDYVKAQMLAAQSYALNRRSNYSKGTVITMKSGNCDQAYCPMNKGCHGQTANLDCGGFKCTSYIPGPPTQTPVASSSLIATYRAYYNELKDLLVRDSSTGKVANTSYVSTVQNQWREKAQQGMNYTQIIQEYYQSQGKNYEIVECSTYEIDSNQTSEQSGEEVGNGITPDYKKISPDKGKFYGYSYNDKSKQEIEINPVWVNANITTVNSNCSVANWNEDYQINTQAVDNYKKAFKNVCNILTNGVTLSNGTTCKYTINDLQGGDTFAQRKTISGGINDISYGIVQDWNYYKEYVVKDVVYRPYNNRNITNYNNFVKALGNEEHCENINYILYEYAYKDAGFEWGGKTTNSSQFNPMRFTVKY